MTITSSSQEFSSDSGVQGPSLPTTNISIALRGNVEPVEPPGEVRQMSLVKLIPLPPSVKAINPGVGASMRARRDDARRMSQRSDRGSRCNDGGPAPEWGPQGGELF